MRHRAFLSPLGWISLSLAGAAALVGGCTATASPEFDGEGGAFGNPTSSSASGAGGDFGAGGNDIIDTGGGTTCEGSCSTDQHSVLDCNGVVQATCSNGQGCDPATKSCRNACDVAVANKHSVGCEYYATFMDSYNATGCFAAFVANTWNTPANIQVEYNGAALAVSQFGYIPRGAGPSLTYDPIDPSVGLPPGEVAILFLSGSTGAAPQCPRNSAVPTGVMLSDTTGIGNSFRISSDVPVVAYEINPYGGGSAAVTGASLLLPTSAWDKNYIAVNASPYSVANPSMNIVAMEDNTQVTMLPKAAVQGGGGIPSSPANTALTFTLQRGQHAQLSQQAELTGSVIEASKPVGFMAGQRCMNVPQGVSYCDHGEQMVPPVQALGSEYVGVGHKPRINEPAFWRVVGAVDGTELTWSSDVGGPTTINQGEAVMFSSHQPFVVKSQDDDHPFLLFSYMTGSQYQSNLDGYGDPDFVISVPPKQYMTKYVFFADPTYPETNIIVIRSKVDGVFKDVNLGCAGTLSGWQSLGEYEWTRVDLSTGNFQGVGACSTGRHEISSEGRFGLWVWGWGTPLTSSFTSNVSYGYPGGMNVQSINTVVVQPTPK